MRGSRPANAAASASDGRPKPVPEAFEQLRADWAANKTSSRAAACKLGIAQDTFLRWVKEK